MLAVRLKYIRSAVAAAAVAVIAACGGGGGGGDGGVSSVDSSAGTGMSFVATALISDVNDSSSNPYSVPNVDAHLVNAWGVAFNPQGFVWVADNGTSTSTLYDGNGMAQSLVVAIPGGTAGAGNPTGLVFNGGTNFVMSANGLSGASPFIFAGESGTIAAWAPNVDMTHAHTVVDNGASGAIYKGLAIASTTSGDRLFATDFHNAKVDMFDGTFKPLAQAFVDPSLPAGYAPFGIQAIGSNVYVTYAKEDAQSKFQVAGAGLGLVDVFDTTGAFVKRLIDVGGVLNAPWGIAMAPANFGPFSNALLVANFGDGRIDAFDATTGAAMGALAAPDGTPISIAGLWGIAFGNGINSQPANTLFYAAGPANQTHGVYGRIDNR